MTRYGMTGFAGDVRRTKSGGKKASDDEDFSIDDEFKDLGYFDDGAGGGGGFDDDDDF